MISSALLDLHANGGDPGNSAPTTLPRPPFRWFTRVLVPGGIVGGIAVVLLVAAWSTVTPAIQVDTELAIHKTVASQTAGTVLVQAAGWIESDPYPIHITSLASGVVETILVLEGETVAAGQVMARLVPDDARLLHQRAVAELAAWQAAVAEAESRLEAATASWNNPVERNRAVAVATAAVAEIAARIARTEAERDRQQAELEQAQRNWRRLRDLGAAAVATDSEVELAGTAVRTSQATVNALGHALAEAKALAAGQAAELEAARQHRELRIEERRELDQAKAARQQTQARLAAAEAELAQAALHVERLLISAPRDGVVVSRYKAPGDRVMLDGDSESAATLFSLYNPRSMQVRVDVPLVDAAKVAVGQPCEIVCDILPETRLSGRVTRILHQADIQKNTLQVKVAIDNPAVELRPEMLARVRFLAAAAPTPTSAAGAVFVPADSVQNGRVWVVAGFDGKRGQAQPRTVASGRHLDGWLEVDNVLPGDLLIRRPPTNLRPGRRVRLGDNGSI